MIAQFLKQIKGINFVDIGSSGALDSKWEKLEPFIHLTGFDPNAAECARMAALPNRFLSLKYLPYAISGIRGTSTLNKTNSIYCYSLLEPDLQWLRRFAYHDLFEFAGTESVETYRLSDIDDLQNADTDIIKTDTQGLELPILSNAGNILNKCFFAETETGFVENYIGETTYAQIDEFMRSQGFLLFDLNINHRISRNNQFKDEPTGAEQILWCEATWMKDYVSLIKNGRMDVKQLYREKALKVLTICALQQSIDYGYELAVVFKELQLIDSAELEALKSKQSWLISGDTIATGRAKKNNMLNLFLRLLPAKLRSEISLQAGIASKQKHLFNL